MASFLLQPDDVRAENFSKIIRTLRTNARMSMAEVARKMDLTDRSYRRFEDGHVELDPERIYRFAEATGSDPIGIILAVLIGDPEFAFRVADSKLMLLLVTQLEDWNRDHRDDITLIEPNAYLASLSHVLSQLATKAREREDIAQVLLEKRFPKLSFSFFRGLGRQRT